MCDQYNFSKLSLSRENQPKQKYEPYNVHKWERSKVTKKRGQEHHGCVQSKVGFELNYKS